jgi:uncharacterized membrane protein YphA (DoxX/SURF4 family)
MLQLVWVACAVVIITAAIRSRHHPSALRTGRLAVGFLFIAAGAAVNAAFLMRGDDYADFAGTSYLSFVRDTWESLVVPNHDLFIPVLVVFEICVGVLALLGGRRTVVAYAAAIAFHVALLPFGWGFFVWSVPMIAALAVLLGGEWRALNDRSEQAEVVDAAVG